MAGIQRLNLMMRNAAGLNKADSRLMHIVSDTKINAVEPVQRFNIRTKDGIIQKFTLGDDFVKVAKFRKIGNKYVQYVERFLGNAKYLK